MLRHEIVKNFIHFQDQTKFEFHPGPNFLIGQNCSGKSSVFEATRRCLEVRKNTSFSNPHFKDKVSSTACVFDIEDAQKIGKLLSIAIRIPSTELADNKVCVKVCFETIENSFGVDLVKEVDSGILVNDKVELQHTEKLTTLCENILENPTADNVDPLIDEIVQCTESAIDTFKRKDDLSRVTDTDCEKILQRFLDDKIVFTFPVRGIGPCQWSLSPKVHNDYKKDNYESAQERSEILQWYLKEKRKEDGVISKDDKALVKKYFGIITNNCGLKFRLEYNRQSSKDELVALYTESGKRRHDEEEPKSFPILKVPEGYLEAMNTSILLGVSKFKTVCLEEPEKGMSPQMIERMRDLVLRRIENKTVLITSHHPYFLGPWTVPKIYIFKRTENEHGINFSIYSGSEIEPEGDDKKAPRIITSDNFAAIFFAKRVLFVEGEGDYLFMSSLKQLLLTDDELGRQLIENDVNILERFRVFLCSLHIINIGGETNKLRLNKLCGKIGMERYFLLDYDAIEDSKGSADTFLNDFHLDKKWYAGVLNDVSMLEREGLFVWNKIEKRDRKSGKIEDAFIELTRIYPGQDRKEFLDENKVILKYRSETTMQSRYKLFRHKELTDENITNVVHNVAQWCVQGKRVGKSTQMMRLIAFLSNISKEQRESFSQ